jgi:hypothetical protein
MPSKAKSSWTALSQLGEMRDRRRSEIQAENRAAISTVPKWDDLLPFRGLGASDTRDNLFALTGLVEADGCNSLVAPDYHMPVVDVYSVFMGKVLHSTKNLRFLKYVEPPTTFADDENTIDAHDKTGPDATSPLSFMPHCQTSQHQANQLVFDRPSSLPAKLPSWVLDWSKENTIQPMENERFAATRNSIHSQPLSDTKSNLPLYGQNIDTVLHISLPLPRSIYGLRSFSTWKQFLKEHLQSNFDSDAEFDSAYAFTIRGGVQSLARGGMDIKSADLTRDTLDLLSLLDAKDNMEDGLKQHVLNTDGELGNLHTLVESICRRRRVAVTERGRMGLVPDHTKEGDVTFLLQGGDVPFVLRQRGDGTFVFVGHCYLHGVMNGEAYEEDKCEDMVLV